jgi:hypothetical protein
MIFTIEEKRRRIERERYYARCQYAKREAHRLTGAADELRLQLLNLQPENAHAAEAANLQSHLDRFLAYTPDDPPSYTEEPEEATVTPYLDIGEEGVRQQVKIHEQFLEIDWLRREVSSLEHDNAVLRDQLLGLEDLTGMRRLELPRYFRHKPTPSSVLLRYQNEIKPKITEEDDSDTPAPYTSEEEYTSGGRTTEVEYSDGINWNKNHPRPIHINIKLAPPVNQDHPLHRIHSVLPGNGKIWVEGPIEHVDDFIATMKSLEQWYMPTEDKAPVKWVHTARLYGPDLSRLEARPPCLVPQHEHYIREYHKLNSLVTKWRRVESERRWWKHVAGEDYDKAQ